MENVTGYKGRGIHSLKLLKSLKEGRLSKLLNIVSGIGNLDVQLRSDYVNIYYEGGRILKINSENSADFDKKYFQLSNKTLTPDDLNARKKALLEKFKEADYKNYFKEAAKVMDAWLKEYPNPERKEQQRLTQENKSGDYIVIDIEYQVSKLSSFAHIEPKKSPRFDIIAVNRQGKLCVIELKNGTGALNGKSGLEEHWDDYNDSIGRNSGQFVDEMKLVLKQKQEFGLIDKSVEIKNSEPVFMFAYSYNDKRERDKFDKAFCKIGARIPCIFLKIGELKLTSAR